MTLVEWGVGRRDVALTTMRAIGSAAILLLVYYLVPIERHPHHSIVLRLGVGLAFFIVVLTVEVRAILRSDEPMLRAGVAMAVVVPLFLVVFAWTYLTMSHSSPTAFNTLLTRTDSLYFTVTVFSTVGFGDITAKTDTARLVVTLQMLMDLVVVAVVVRLILGAASRGVARRSVADG